MREMWRAWKKRRDKLGNGLEKAKSARNAANKASENFVKVSRRIVQKSGIEHFQMLPFSRKRERQHLIAELQKQLQRKEKSTQTDYGYPHCEEAYTETSDVDSCVTDFRNSVISDKCECTIPQKTMNNAVFLQLSTCFLSQMAQFVVHPVVRADL